MSESTAYRRCHVCGTFCEQPDPIRRCAGCGKPFAPFYYYDDATTPVLNTANLRPTPLGEGVWRPIQGLTAVWSTD